MTDFAETLVAVMAPGVKLVVRSDKYGTTFQTWLGEYPSGKSITFTVFDAAGLCGRMRVLVPEEGAPCLWVSHTCFELPWLELLKVADFLRLDIPLSIPPGEQVPA